MHPWGHSTHWAARKPPHNMHSCPRALPYPGVFIFTSIFQVLSSLALSRGTQPLPCGFWDQTQVSSFGGKYIYMLILLTPKYLLLYFKIIIIMFIACYLSSTIMKHFQTKVMLKEWRCLTFKSLRRSLTRQVSGMWPRSTRPWLWVLCFLSADLWKWWFPSPSPQCCIKNILWAQNGPAPWGLVVACIGYWMGRLMDITPELMVPSWDQMDLSKHVLRGGVSGSLGTWILWLATNTIRANPRETDLFVHPCEGSVLVC